MCLQPVTDVRDKWVALSLSFPTTGRSPDGAALVRILDELDMVDALGMLSCIVQVDDITAFESGAGEMTRPGQIILRIPVAQCTNVALQAEFMRLKKEGFAFMAEGIPQPGTSLDAHVGMLCVAADSVADLSTVQWTTRLPGPHMAVGVSSLMQYEDARASEVRWFAGMKMTPANEELSRQDTITRGRLLRLLELVTQDADIAELEILLKQDPALSYQLFRLLGSAAFTFKVEITSFTQAINLLGRRQLQRWLQLLLYARPAGNDGMRNSLLPKAAARAALMEALCRAYTDNRDEQDKAFLVGMFSLLDVLFGVPLEQILTPLKLGADITDALMAREGTFGQLLAIAVCAEEGTLTAQDLDDAGVAVDVFNHSLVHAYRWASRVSSEE